MKRKTKEKKPFGLKKQLIIYFLVFCTLILGVLWILQVGLFNEFYKNISSDKLYQAAEEIKTLSPKSFEEYVVALGQKDTICSRIWKINKAGLSSVADYHTDRSCFVHSITKSNILYFFSLAASGEDGSYSDFISAYDADKYSSDRGSISIDGNIHAQAPSGSGQSTDTLLYAMIFQSDGEQYFVLMSITVLPMNSATETLTIMLSWVSAVALILCVALAIIVSSRIARPLKRLGEKAQLLPEGRFPPPENQGCAEICRLEQSLWNANTEIQKVEGLRRELLSNFSHDLRTPITLISGYSELMKEIPEEITTENLDAILEETKRLSGLVNDMLDISKLEAGMEKTEPQSFDVTKMTEDILSRVSALSPKNYKFSFYFGEHKFVYADPKLISRAIYNLITNAINHAGDPPSVSVYQSETGDMLKLQVVDNGEGIAPEEMEFIWERYYRGKKAHKRAAVGTGLGLSIVKKILKLHQCPIGAESRLGHGSCFWFELPLAK
ncbi:MAG: HAMP domain-containing histidine kinase [Ruminococcaceae bacterium]|nr:HAMP domain-containing histidine kinase [Oscillospiraceae bacterium]